MTQKTIDILNELNKKFYDETGSVVWNQSPNYFWEGWYQLTKYINESLRIKIESGDDTNLKSDKNLPLEVEVAATLSCDIMSEEWQSKTNMVDNITENSITNSDKEATSTMEIQTTDGKMDLAPTFHQNYKVLDLGCGNGRFANFLKSELDDQTLNQTEYLGVDFSVNFMNRSQSNMQKQLSGYELREMDILKDLNQLESTKFDLIVIFGLIHHIPSLKARNHFFKDVKKLLSPNGLLIFTTWQYLDTPRLIKRVVDPETPEGLQIYNKLGIKKTDLEDGDNILDWVKKIFCLRYSHYFSDQETDCLIKETDLELIHSFVCDGRDSKRNRYFVCRRKI
jgi:tRNA (uracil-5-)-methyltransferase TRM9